MSRRAQENLVAVILLGLFLGVIAMSLGYGPRARLVPLPIASLGAILVLAQLVLQNLQTPDRLQVDVLQFITRGSAAAPSPGANETKTPEPSLDKSDATAGQDGHYREIKALAIVGVLLGMFYVIGPIPSILIFTALYFVVSGQYGFVRGSIYACLFTLLVYFMFVYVLETQIHDSLMEKVIGGYIEW